MHTQSVAQKPHSNLPYRQLQATATYPSTKEAPGVIWGHATPTTFIGHSFFY
jgi:hypothetical protein